MPAKKKTTQRESRYGKSLQRLTLWVPKEFAQRFSDYCAQHDTSKGRVITEVVGAHIRRAKRPR